MSERLGARPWQFQGITGRRKGTAFYCPTCGDWHPTHRGLEATSACEGAQRDSTAGAADPRLAVYIPRERLGTQRKRFRIPFRVEGLTH